MRLNCLFLTLQGILEEVIKDKETTITTFRKLGKHDHYQNDMEYYKSEKQVRSEEIEVASTLLDNLDGEDMDQDFATNPNQKYSFAGLDMAMANYSENIQFVVGNKWKW